MINWEMKEKVCKYKPKIITFRQTKNAYFKLCNQELSNVLGMSVKFSLAQMTSMNTGEDCLRVIKKRVREQDISYMTWEWKNAFRVKKRYARMFAKDRTVKNLELKRKY